MSNYTKHTEMEKIEIHTEYIQLDQLLKWAGLISTGGQIKGLLEDKQIYLNGVLCTEKRKKIRPGDVIDVKNQGSWTVVKKEEE